MAKNFIDISDISTNDVLKILNLAAEIKKNPTDFEVKLKNKKAIILLEKHSTRTRLSFEFAVKEMGGIISILNSDSTQIARGESIEDTAKLFDRYADIVIHRTFGHDRLLKCKKASVINALTDKSHPCQIMADLQTFIEHKGDISGKKIAWIGDINNVLQSWIEAAEKLNFYINICCPIELQGKIPISKNCSFIENKNNAVKECDAVTTDTWVSMGEEKDKIKIFEGLTVDQNLMESANNNAIFLHCLPAYRGYEVSSEVMEKYENIIFDQAENRLHVQKAIILWCLYII